MGQAGCGNQLQLEDPESKTIHLRDEQVARVGVVEAKRHELLDEYPVLKEKEKIFVAQFKFTLLLLPGGTKKVTGLQLDEEKVASTHSVQNEEIKKLLASSANPKKNKKKKKDAPKDKADETGDAAAK